MFIRSFRCYGDSCNSGSKYIDGISWSSLDFSALSDDNSEVLKVNGDGFINAIGVYVLFPDPPLT